VHPIDNGETLLFITGAVAVIDVSLPEVMIYRRQSATFITNTHLLNADIFIFIGIICRRSLKLMVQIRANTLLGASL